MQYFLTVQLHGVFFLFFLLCKAVKLKLQEYCNVFVSLRCTDVYLCLQEMTQIFQLHLRSVFPLPCSISVVIWLPICLPVYRVSCFHTVHMLLLPVASCFASFSTIIPWQNSHVGCRTGLKRFFLTLLFFCSIWHNALHCLQNFPLFTVRRAESATATSVVFPSILSSVRPHSTTSCSPHT